jgi:hypothetical protein
MNMTAGCRQRATQNIAFMSFSPSPIHLDVNEDTVIEKKVEFVCDAIHLPIN